MTRENFEQEFVRGTAALGDFGGDVFALGSLHQIDLVERHALALGETDRGASRGTAGVVGNGLWRTVTSFSTSACLAMSPRNPGSEAARSAEVSM